MSTGPSKGLLYRPHDEHDSCGVGFVADLSGQPSHAVLETALTALARLAHRGAVGADGTGDGAGVLTQLSYNFFSNEVERLGYTVPGSRDLAVGMFFLPRDDEATRRQCRQIAVNTIARAGLVVFGWRPVPVDESTLGAKAISTAPKIEQLLIGRGGVEPAQFETALYTVRRGIEQQTADIKGFYISSLSARTVVYKGLLVGTQLKPFYRDLSDRGFQTSLAIMHQRYSTNTFPNWSLAQPFRMLGHNGEINTIGGNRNWIRAREAASGASSSVIWSEGSDSASLDNVLEAMVMNGSGLTQSMMMLIPEAYEDSPETPASLRAFYDYAACLTEPWDGPAAVAFSDGRVAGAALDRNGLRPARYAVTSEGLVIAASEAGAIDLDPEAIIEKGRLGPGQMIAVDTERGLLLRNNDIKAAESKRRSYANHVRRMIVSCPDNLEKKRRPVVEEPLLIRRMKAFGYTIEDIERILEPMFGEGKEPVGSMGDDTPLAVLSSKPRLLYSYFKQRFAQVTNPAIDPIRERLVMSLTTLLGPRVSVIDETRPEPARVVKFASPVLSDEALEWLQRSNVKGLRCQTLEVAMAGHTGLRAALDELCERAGEAVDNDSTILVLDDTDIDESRVPLPMLLAVGAVHNHLIRTGRRMRCSLIARTGEARDDHQIACLIGSGANAVNPCLAFEVIASEARREGQSVSGALKNYRKALEYGLLKIMAKMGISTIASYCGAQAFEIVGMDAGVVEEYFTGASERIGGIGLVEIARDALSFHQAAFTEDSAALEDAGYFRYRTGGEYHTFNPTVFRALHRLARTGNHDEYDQYAAESLQRAPAVLRDLMDFRARQPITVDEVEPAAELMARFSTSGMSLGALSSDAHETLAVAMNRMGARSNSGEGGEDRRRYHPRPGGDLANSRIKQVASARFGVTPEYLLSADELEIKIAQGSKPGEGGQLPGHKVTAEIAAIRHSVPGVTLISPPPHHDIYSIEDLAQLIYDLKQTNPDARVAVKLVSEAGIGTIAAGVAKASADVIHISGHDGGTGASPLGSIKNAGTPWELGLAETQQVLVMNDLRGRVRLRVDGGLKTGRDVLIAAALGAEEFGFASAAIVALGCVMARQCHLNTCPVGIATQDPRLRKKFAGTPENVIRFFHSLAEDIRRLLANLGLRSLDEIVGRSDLLLQKSGVSSGKTASLDLSPILASVEGSEALPARFAGVRHQKQDDSMNNLLAKTCAHAIHEEKQISASFEIRNTDRTVGARLAGMIASRYGDAGLPEGTIDLAFRGSAGQSFGAFNIAGLKLTLVGDANDYVGKGMSGGEIVIRPPDNAGFEWSKNVIIGNTVMYGATGGSLFAAGRAGERFCVRNSGGLAVVEGLGDHGCEYMTAGVVVVLGEVGRNFAAGMTGGIAYVLDEQKTFQKRCNLELVEFEPIPDDELQTVRVLVERHAEATGSPLARNLLASWESFAPFFLKVVTQAEAARRQEAEVPRIDVPLGLGTTNTLAAAE
jgi:glutamate synthase domain-containing protein 2/glutamate synthase domain-containing protein 1/glutamate synthase domain-containing protein 3